MFELAGLKLQGRRLGRINKIHPIFRSESVVFLIARTRLKQYSCSGEGVPNLYEEVLVPGRMGDVAILTRTWTLS